jgi:hypothetical protein
VISNILRETRSIKVASEEFKKIEDTYEDFSKMVTRNFKLPPSMGASYFRKEMQSMLSNLEGEKKDVFFHLLECEEKMTKVKRSIKFFDIHYGPNRCFDVREYPEERPHTFINSKLIASFIIGFGISFLIFA